MYAPTKEDGVCDKRGGSLILRDDDKPETVKKRLGVYHDQTQPLIDYYTNAGILKEVDGTIEDRRCVRRDRKDPGSVVNGTEAGNARQIESRAG